MLRYVERSKRRSVLNAKRELLNVKKDVTVPEARAEVLRFQLALHHHHFLLLLLLLLELLLLLLQIEVVEMRPQALYLVAAPYFPIQPIYYDD